jgi:type IV pilus assembly protein PilW
MRTAAGLSLVEMLVAMVIVLMVVAGSITFVTRGRAAHRTTEALAQLEESLDAGVALLVDEIRLAGYLGLAPPASAVAGSSPLGSAERPDLAVSGACGRSLALDLAVPVVAVDGAYAAAPGVALGCRPSPDGRAAPGADTLILRHASPESTRAQAGRLQLLTNLRSAALAANGVATLGAGARWHDLEVGVYYVSLDSTGRAGWPSLRRKRLVGGTRPAFQDEELVSGVTDLQIRVGLDDPADADTAVDRWIAPGEAAAGGIPRALRIELEAISDVAEPGLAGANRRKRVSRVIELRNASPPR